MTMETNDLILTSEIWPLVSMTKKQFEMIYVNTINHYAKHLDNAIMLKADVQCAINTLKLRRAYMLPIGADAETCYQQQEAWTYACFIASLMRCTWLNAWQLTQDLLPQQGLSWLKSHPNVYRALAAQTYDQNNILLQLVEKANQIKPNDTYKKSADISKPSLCSVFIHWLKNAFANQQFVVNGKDSLIYNIEAGLLLTMPDIFDVFINANPEIIHEHFSNNLNKDRFTQLLLNSKKFILSDDYILGNWADRNTVKGLVLTDISVLPELADTPINQSLKPDIRLR